MRWLRRHGLPDPHWQAVVREIGHGRRRLRDTVVHHGAKVVCVACLSWAAVAKKVLSRQLAEVLGHVLLLEVDPE
jgi:hypothetical protein